MSSKPLAVVAADLHLDEGIWGETGAKYDSMFSCEQIFAAAAASNIPVILCGDVIDVKRPSSAVISFLKKTLVGFKKNTGLPVYYVQGQHEMADPPWLSVIGGNAVTHIHKQTIELGTSKVYGLDWTPADRLAGELQQIPKETNLLICHQVWQEFMGSITSPEGSLREAPYVSKIITGDYHNYVAKIVSSTIDGRDVSIVSPGATHMRKINEPVKHYYLLLNSDLTHKRIELKTRLVYDLQAATKAAAFDLISEVDAIIADLSGKLAKYPLPLRKPILRVTFAEEAADFKSKLITRVKDKALLFWVDPKKEDQPIGKTKAKVTKLQRLGPVSCLNKLVAKDSVHYAPLVRLLTAKEEPKIVLAMMKKERLS